MDGLILRLSPDNQEPQDLTLQQHRLASSVLDTASYSSSYVFNDYKYSAQLLGAKSTIHNLVILLNGNEIKFNYSFVDGMIYFQDISFGQRIFLECYGFVQFTVAFDDDQGTHWVLDTEYIQVLVRKGIQNNSVRRMTEFIYSKNPELLSSNKTIPRDTSGLKDFAQQTVEAHILLLEKISVTYDENYRYFRMNSRFTTIPKERVDHFEKLQYVSQNTLQYIAQHPEELQRLYHSSGIRVGKNHYQPNKTLITCNEKSFDIYENRVVVGFLLFLLSEIKRIETELSDILDQMPIKPLETGEYITSSYFIYASTLESVRILLTDIRRLKQKYTRLYSVYSKTLPIKVNPVTALPRFTPLFKSIPQYHQIYGCITAWFSQGVFSIQEKQFMLSFIKISALYEIYVLSKLINYFKNAGCSLVNCEKITYPSPGKYYENTCCNNKFVFQNTAVRITIYYQPVIYNTDRSVVSGIGLYRNTSISFPKSEQSRKYGGKYYTPDYLIKYEYWDSGKVKYIVADAKFSRLQTVKEREVAELVYKYLFSLSPGTENEEIVGMCVFNGQSSSLIDGYTNIYDYELPLKIIPRADIVTLTENSEKNEELHEALLKYTVGAYITENQSRTVTYIPEHERQFETAPNNANIEYSMHENNAPMAERDVSEMAYSMMDTDIEKQSGFTILPLNEKRSKKKKNPEPSEIAVSELDLPKTITMQLNAKGYASIKDLIPNGKKSDLLDNPILNRKFRREIEARIKKWKIVLH